MTTSTASQLSQPQQDAPIINILGQKVALGPSTREQVATVYRWMNDFRVSSLSGDPLRPATLETLYAEYDRDFAKTETGSNTRWVSFALYERAGLRLIGGAGLRNIDHSNRTATFGIMIGEKDCWHKGYGTEATKLVLDYGFTALNLHNVDLTTYSYNAAALKAYTRAGFREIGRRRESIRWHNKIYDEVIMDCLATEFEGSGTSIIEIP